MSASQTLSASYRYDPFGNLISSSGSLASANVYRFSSKEIHVQSGMYYYLYRFYDPNFQRWINRDPISELGGLNLYGFNRNNGVSRIDATGLDGCDVLNALRAAALDDGDIELYGDITAVMGGMGCFDPPPPEPAPAPKFCPIPHPKGGNPSTNRTWCQNHPAWCVGIGVGLVGVGVAVTCAAQPELCAVAVRVGVGAGRVVVGAAAL